MNHLQNQDSLQNVGKRITLSTLGAMGKEWMKIKKGEVKESTFAVYHQCMEKHILPALGELPLCEVTEQCLNMFLNDLMEHGNLKTGNGLCWKTVSDIRSVLKMILVFGSERGYPELSGISMKLPKSRKNTTEILTCREQQILEDYLLEHLTPTNLGILLSLYTGLRIGEICGMRWGDIDFDRGVLTVERTVNRIREISEQTPQKTKVIITVPKTIHSIRTIPVPKDILALLEDNKTEKNMYILTRNETFLEPRTLQQRYKRILQDAGLRDIRYHALRHTFASRCVEQNFDMKSLSEILGHSSARITMDRYVHPSMEYKREQMDRLNLRSAQE